MDGEQILRNASSLTGPLVMPLSVTLASPVRVGDVDILGDALLPQLLPPVVQPLMPRVARPLRVTLGNVDILGDAGLTPPTARADDLPHIGRIGWWWDTARQQVCAYVTTPEGTYCVRLPLARVWRAFAQAAAEAGCPMEPVVAGRQCTVDGLFSAVKRAVKKTAKKVVPAKVQQIAKSAQKKLAPIARRAAIAADRFGRATVKMASHPAFGAAMGALAVAPPLTAVGGAGLAAYTAAQAAKRVISAADAAAAGLRQGKAIVRQLGSGAPKKALAAAARDPKKALAVAQRIALNARQLPSRGTASARLTLAALRSVG